MSVEVIPVPGIPEVEPGDDLPAILIGALERARPRPARAISGTCRCRQLVPLRISDPDL